MAKKKRGAEWWIRLVMQLINTLLRVLSTPNGKEKEVAQKGLDEVSTKIASLDD